MTEENTTTTEAPPPAQCIVGRSKRHPCPFPATEPVPRWGEDEPQLCAFHAATEPLVDEVNDLALSRELMRDYLKDAREYPGAGPLVDLLERAEADFASREARLDKVLSDLLRAEYKLLRG